VKLPFPRDQGEKRPGEWVNGEGTSQIAQDVLSTFAVRDLLITPAKALLVSVLCTALLLPACNRKVKRPVAISLDELQIRAERRAAV
jgi:hypothetical protein